MNPMNLTPEEQASFVEALGREIDACDAEGERIITAALLEADILLTAEGRTVPVTLPDGTVVLLGAKTP